MPSLAAQKLLAICQRSRPRDLRDLAALLATDLPLAEVLDLLLRRTPQVDAATVCWAVADPPRARPEDVDGLAALQPVRDDLVRRLRGLCFAVARGEAPPSSAPRSLSALQWDLLHALFRRDRRWSVTGAAAQAFHRPGPPVSTLELLALPATRPGADLSALFAAAAACGAQVYVMRPAPGLLTALVGRDSESCHIHMTLDSLDRPEGPRLLAGGLLVDSPRAVACHAIVTAWRWRDASRLLPLVAACDGDPCVAQAVDDALAAARPDLLDLHCTLAALAVYSPSILAVRDELLRALRRRAYFEASGRPPDPPPREQELDVLRRQGARIGVIAFIFTCDPEPSILLARSARADVWMAPQEGVDLAEGLTQALTRGLREECRISADAVEQWLDPNSLAFLGVLEGHRSSTGRRIADDADGDGTEFADVIARRKAFWGATLHVPRRDALLATANPDEIAELAWCSLGAARELIARSNTPDKAELLLTALEDRAAALGTALRPGRELGARLRVRVTRPIDVGDRRAVFEALDLDGGRRVAVKVSTSTHARARLEHEGAVMASLAHDNIITLLDHGLTQDGVPFLILEYVEGETLSSALRAGPFSPGRALTIATQLAGALAYLHDRGVVHQDLKPDNVMLQRGDSGPEQVKLIDFGCANRELDVTGGYDVQHYFAPEARNGGRLSRSADMYSFGVLLRQTLSGAIPPDAGDLAQDRRPPPRPGARLPGAADLDDLLARLMHDDPDVRPSARDVLAALGELGTRGSVPPATTLFGSSEQSAVV
jgi:hypothetical protein